jgi:hypothetical protein
MAHSRSIGLGVVVRRCLPTHDLHFVPTFFASHLVPLGGIGFDALEQRIRVDLLVVFDISVAAEAKEYLPAKVLRGQKILRRARQIMLQGLQLGRVRGIEKEVALRQLQGGIVEELHLLRTANPAERLHLFAKRRLCILLVGRLRVVCRHGWRPPGQRAGHDKGDYGVFHFLPRGTNPRETIPAGKGCQQATRTLYTGGERREHGGWMTGTRRDPYRLSGLCVVGLASLASESLASRDKLGKIRSRQSLNIVKLSDYGGQ